MRVPRGVYIFSGAALLMLYGFLFWLIEQGNRQHQQATVPWVAMSAAVGTGFVATAVAVAIILASRRKDS